MGDSYRVGQAGAVGPNSHAENITFNQIWHERGSEIDVPALASDLLTLREFLRSEARSPEEDEAVAEVSKALRAATSNDGPKALEHLQGAGKWALTAATAIGTTVAAAALKVALGL